MKRTLSLLLALVMVVTMIPAVFAETDDPDIDFGELLGTTAELAEDAVVDEEYTTRWDTHYYELAVEEAGKLQLTVVDGTIAVQDKELTNNTFDVEEGKTYIVVVTGEGATWGAAVHTHTDAYTDNGDGTHDAICSVCGEVMADDEAHTYTDGICACGAKSGPVQMPTVGITNAGLVLKDYIGLQLALNKTTMNEGNYDKAYYTFVQKNPDGSVAESGTITFNMATGNYVGAEIPVMAWSMADTYEVTVFWEADGVTYQGATTITSIKAQAMSRISKNQYVDLCIAMLNYGANVQDTFNHNDSDASYLANYDLTAEQKVLPAFDELTLTEQIVIPEGDLKPTTKGLSAKDKIILQFAVKNKDLSGYEVRYTLDGGDEIVIPYSEFMSMTSSGSTYTGPKFALTPRQMRSEIKLAFHNAATGEKVYGDIICSVAAFAKDHKDKTTESVIIAMMVYGDAALAAFGK